MSKIVIQMGHVARTTGAVGTHREQEFVRALGHKLVAALNEKGHDIRLIGADSSVPASDVFIALHTDGNVNRSIRGASVGYPSNDPNSSHGKLAQAWKRHHQALGFPGGFHRDNYTQGLRFYYGFGKSSSKWKFLAEHGTTTNPQDEAWLFANIDKCVQAHVNAIGEVVGHPIQLPDIDHGEEDEMKPRLVRAPSGAVYAFDGVALRSANNVHYQNVVRWYSGQSEPWDNWSQEQIDAFPKDPGAPES